MAHVIVTLKMMPESPDTDLARIQEEAKAKVTAYGGNVNEVKEEPVAFGLKAILIVFVMDESKGSTDPLEEQLGTIEGVVSVEATDVRRTLG